MQLKTHTIGLYHPHNFNRSIIVEYLRLVLDNAVEQIDSWENVVTCDCSILVLIEPEMLSNQLKEQILKKTIYAFNKKVIIVPFYEQKRIETTENITVLNHTVTMKEFISTIKEIETQIILKNSI